MSRMVVPFKSWHFEWLKAPVVLTAQELQVMESQTSRSFIIDGQVVAAAGAAMFWPGRHQVWSYMTPASGPYMRWMTREVERELKTLKGRIEMTVLCEFDAGHRWAKMLGFEVETPIMRGYAPDGASHTMYTRMN